jgi:hypothetical protein
MLSRPDSRLAGAGYMFNCIGIEQSIDHCPVVGVCMDVPFHRVEIGVASAPRSRVDFAKYRCPW